VKYSDGLQVGTSEFDNCQVQETFLYSMRPNRLCGPHSLLFSGYQDCFPEGNADGA
jgi:hypothetical protein